jgi:hypothetical protein
MKELQKKEINWKRIIRGFLAYGFGIGLGSFLVWALWLRNRDVPSFWPEGMVKDKITNALIEPNTTNDCYLKCMETNDSLVRNLLKKGDVKFSISKTRKVAAPIYAIDTRTVSGEKVRWWIESKDSTYNIFRIDDLPGTTKNHLCDCTPINF